LTPLLRMIACQQMLPALSAAPWRPSMTNPDYRALCEQLMELAEGKRYDGSAVIAKARAVLAKWGHQ